MNSHNLNNLLATLEVDDDPTGGGSIGTPGGGGGSIGTPGGGGGSIGTPGGGSGGGGGTGAPGSGGHDLLNLEDLIPSRCVTDFFDNAISWAATIAFIVAIMFIIYGGYQILTAADDPKKVSAGAKTIRYTIIGLIIIFLSKAIVAFIRVNILKL